MNLFNWFRKLKKQEQSGYWPGTSAINPDSNVSSFSDDYSASSEDIDTFNGFDGGDFGGGGSGGSFDDSSSDSSDGGDSGDSGSSSSD